jgi:hypothetical protein
MSFVCERVRKAAANKRLSEQSEQMHTERAEAFFLRERRRRRRIQSVMRERLLN